MILSGIQFHSKKSWTETKPEWKVLEQKQRILQLHKSFSCVQMEQKRWSHDLNGELTSSVGRNVKKAGEAAESHLGAAPS